MPNKNIKIALLQHASPQSQTQEQSLDLIDNLIAQAASQNAKIAFTQELFLTHYFPQEHNQNHFDLAETIPGPSSNHLCQTALKNKIAIVASIFELAAPGLHYNTSISISPQGKIIGKYRKLHIPHDPDFYEKYYFTPGDLSYQTHNIQNLPVGQLICWDQWFPEAARLTAMQGAHLINYPTAIGWCHNEPAQEQAAQQDAWITILRSHAIANNIYICATNRIGTEKNLTFWGSSLIIDPQGLIIAQASKDKQEIITAEINPNQITTTRRTWPFFRDRRTDTYTDLTQKFGPIKPT